MAIRQVDRQLGAALQSNLSPLDFLARSNSGGKGWSGSEIALHGQPVVFQLGPRQGFEPPQIPVLGRVVGVGQQLVVGQGVDGPPGQNLEHLGGQLRLREGPPQVTWMPRISAISRRRRGRKMATAKTRGTLVTMMARMRASRWIPREPACPAEISESPEWTLSAAAVRWRKSERYGTLFGIPCSKDRIQLSNVLPALITPWASASSCRTRLLTHSPARTQR